MNKLFVLFVLLNYCGFSQVDSTKLTVIDVAKEIENPIMLVLHSMGDVNVKGHQGDRLFVYSQELMPSLSELMNEDNREEVFTYFDKHNRTIRVKQNNSVRVQQLDSIFKIESNVFTFNSNLFVLTPDRSSVSVNIQGLGNISVEEIDGDVEASTQTGGIFIKDTEGQVAASTVNGNIISDFSEQEQIQPLFLSTLMGNIEVIIPRTSKNTILVSSELGDLSTNIDVVNINVAASSDNNRVKNRKININLNGGNGSNPDFIASTFKGDIYLRHLEE